MIGVYIYMKDILFAFTENIGLFYLIYQFLSKNISLKTLTLAYILCSVLESLLAITFGNIITFPFLFTFTAFFIYWLTRNFVTSILTLFSTIILFATAQYASGFIMVLIGKPTGNYNSTQISTTILFFIVNYAIIYVSSFFIIKILSLTKKTTILFSKKVYLGTLLTLLGLIVAFFFTTSSLEKYYENDHTILQVTNALFLAFGLIIMLTFTILFKSLTRETEVQKRKLELDQLRIYSNKLEENYQEYRKFRHDYLNMYTGMVGYIETKDMAGLEHYFTEHIVPISQSITTNLIKLADLYRIEIPELKGLVATKLLLAQEKGMDISCEVPTPVTRINMDILDLCTAIGILLDNAIEATESIENGRIRLSFITYEDRVLITIENQIEDLLVPIYQLFEHGFSTKGSGRGLGLWNLSEMMDKSDVIHLDTAIENHYFIQQLNIMEESTYD